MIQDVIGVAAEVERNERAAKFHPDQGGHDCSQVRPTVFLGRVDAPEAHLFRSGLQFAILFRLDAGGIFALVFQHLMFERHEFTVYETPDGLLNHFLFVAEREIHSRSLSVWLDAQYCYRAIVAQQSEGMLT